MPYLYNSLQIFQDAYCQMPAEIPFPWYALENPDLQVRSSRRVHNAFQLQWKTWTLRSGFTTVHMHPFPITGILFNPKICHLHSILNFSPCAHFTSRWVTYWTDAIYFLIVTLTCCPDSLSLAYYPWFSVIYLSFFSYV